MYQIDATDKKIIRLLTENARISYLEIARQCGVSGAAIHQRVNKLEQNNVFKGNEYILNPEVFGFQTCAYVGIFLEKSGMYKDVLKELKNIPEVIESHYTTGKYAIFIKLFCKDNNHLMEVLNGTIQSINGVASTETFISLDQAIQRQISIQ